MPRTIPDLNWNKKEIIGTNCMEIITTGFYDDNQVWEDNKIWWDDGASGLSWNNRPEETLNWN